MTEVDFAGRVLVGCFWMLIFYFLGFEAVVVGTLITMATKIESL